jgi:hypothetical protein
MRICQLGDGGKAMVWYRQVQFVAAVPMPPEVAEAFGTTVNGMWADPGRRTANEVAQAHRNGERVLFSVPMIALTPNTYEAEVAAHLLDEVCRDVDGGSSECDWYYWESKPVYAACIYSDAFRGYLMDRCREGVDRGNDVVNLDEIMTGIGLMNRKPGGSGFCTRCLARFRAHVHGLPVDDGELRAALKAEDDLYERYRRFHEEDAFRVMTAFIRELRAYADERNPGFAISANVAYLGNAVPTLGALWGCSWGRHLDFVMMENHYRVERGSPHLVLPRGTFAPWYRLGSSFKGSPAWICPSITVPRQMEGQPRTAYYELMFLEAYANRGRWGYYWWPGVDVRTRLAATAPEALKDHIRFIRDHRELYEDAVPSNELAILYADDAIAVRPETHDKYVALAQALAERSMQFDVVYVGDGRFNPDELDPEALSRYRAVLLPEAQDLGPVPAAALEAFARAGGEATVYSDSPLAPELVRTADGQMLFAFWKHYRDEDRERILASVQAPPSARIESSDRAVVVTRYGLGDRQVLHLLNYRYDEASDTVTPARDLRLHIPWDEGPASAVMLDLDGERELMAKGEDGTLVVDIPELAVYGVLVIDPDSART